MQMTSTPALRSASTRSSRSGPTPTAAPTRSRPKSSLAAKGCAWAFSMSLMVTSPFRNPPPSITSSFSMRFLCRSSLALSTLVPSAMVIELLGHHRADRLLEVPLEADVAVGEDPDRPPVGGDHRQAGDLVPLHQLERDRQLLVGADGDAG